MNSMICDDAELTAIVTAALTRGVRNLSEWVGLREETLCTANSDQRTSTSRKITTDNSASPWKVRSASVATKVRLEGL
jgi:hypothetical protein